MKILRKIKQYFCSHLGSTTLTYWDKDGIYRTVEKCDYCGLGYEDFEAAEKYLLERDK